MNNPIIGIIMGSDSDLQIMSEASKFLEEMGVICETTLVSAHRTPERLEEYAKSAKGRGLKVIIAGAGGSAHLPGMVAAQTSLPVIGVPVKTKNMDGLDSLLSIVQMPKGIPVATVAVNGATNAALLAIKILALSDESLSKKLADYQNAMKETVLEKASKLEKIGYKEYLKND